MICLKAVAPPLAVIFMCLSVQYLATSGRSLNFTLSEAVWNHCGDWFTWKMTVLVLSWAWLSIIIPVGAIKTGSSTASYRENGVLFYWLTLIFFFVLQASYPSTSTTMFLTMPKFTGTLNTTCLLISLILLLKGRTCSRTEDSTMTTTNPVTWDYLAGVEQDPRLLGTDVKQVVISRSGMILWQILICAFYMAGVERHGFNTATLINLLLQSVYIAKFFWWETGYFISTKRCLGLFGYFKCWYSLVLVPTFYTYSSYYLAEQPSQLTIVPSVVFGVIGVSAIVLNYVVDNEKFIFRNCTNHECNIWGKPASYILAEYNDNSGIIKQSALLTSGFWGVGRRLNYTFELVSAFCWCACGYGHSNQTFLYFFYLLVKLIYLFVYGEFKCRRKYGMYWSNYCEMVPYVFLPMIY